MFEGWEKHSFVLFVAAGSVAHALTKWYRSRNDEGSVALDRIDYVILSILAGFAGFIGGNLAGLLTSDPQAKLAIAGLAAWAGVEGLRNLLDAALGILSKGAGK